MAELQSQARIGGLRANIRSNPEAPRQESSQNRNSLPEANNRTPQSRYEQNYASALLRARNGEDDIRHIESYRSQFKKSSFGFYGIFMLLSLVEYILGFVEDAGAVTVVWAIVLIIIQVLVFLILLLMTFRVNKHMKKMQTAMEGIINGISLSDQRRKNRANMASDYQQTKQQASEKIKSATTKIQSIRGGGTLASKGVQTGARNFTGKMAAGQAGNAIPLLNFFPWDLLNGFSIFKHEKKMYTEGMNLVNEYIQVASQEAQEKKAYASLLAQQSSE